MLPRAVLNEALQLNFIALQECCDRGNMGVAVFYYVTGVVLLLLMNCSSVFYLFSSVLSCPIMFYLKLHCS